MAGLRWGVKTTPQHTTYEAMQKIWHDAEQTPAFESAWLFDHFNPIQGSLDDPSSRDGRCSRPSRRRPRACAWG